VFERFTEPSRAVLIEAESLAIELGSRHISAGHILYGCAEGREETAGKPLHDCGIIAASIRRLLPRTEDRPAGQVDLGALGAIGIDYQGVRAAVEETFGPGALEAAPDRRAPTAGPRKPPFTPEAKRSLELTLRAAEELHQERIVPGHLLLGLLRLDNEFVWSVIDEADSSVAALSSAVLSQLAAAV
jgi:ATP-dependent Clp protease ATP-binding subunit ClpA